MRDLKYMRDLVNNAGIKKRMKHIIGHIKLEQQVIRLPWVRQLVTVAILGQKRGLTWEEISKL